MSAAALKESREQVVEFDLCVEVEGLSASLFPYVGNGMGGVVEKFVKRRVFHRSASSHLDIALKRRLKVSIEITKCVEPALQFRDEAAKLGRHPRFGPSPFVPVEKRRNWNKRSYVWHEGRSIRQVVNLLRQVEVGVANWKSMSQACKEAEIVEQT